MSKHAIVTREEWLAARRELMTREKALMRQQDELAAARRSLPWVRITKDYAFDGPRGRATLAELFDGRSQLVVYHFMFGPDDEAGCKSCSFWADHFDGVLPHLHARDVSLVAVSRADRSKLAPYAKRLGWSFDWYSSHGSDFNFDFDVSFRPEQIGQMLYNFGTANAHIQEKHGVSTFVRDRDEIFHAYSTFARGAEAVNGTYHFLDIAPKGRDEDALPYTMAWVRRHDEYGT